MAAPEYVPSETIGSVRTYRSPDHTPDGWSPSRESDIAAEHPMGGEFGFQGPDQGYALTIAERMAPQMQTLAGESRADALAGAVLVGMKRASLFGRAPVVHDIEIGMRVWGLLDTAADELADLRRSMFEGISHAHHYGEARHVVDAVPEDVLRQTPAEVARLAAGDWRSVLRLHG